MGIAAYSLNPRFLRTTFIQGGDWPGRCFFTYLLINVVAVYVKKTEIKQNEIRRMFASVPEETCSAL